MAILRMSAAAVNAEMDALTALFNVGGAGKIDFYTGTAPASVATVATGILVGTSLLSATAFAAAVNGVATGNAVAQSSTVIAGGPYNLGYARISDGAGTAIMDADVGVGAAFTVNIANTVTVQTADAITVQSFTLTQGGIA